MPHTLEQFAATCRNLLAAEPGPTGREKVRALLDEVLTHMADLDATIESAADRPAAQLDPVERAVLWIGAAELQFHPDVPVNVVINEAVELAREFGAEGSHRYVNGVLDTLAARGRSGPGGA